MFYIFGLVVRIKKATITIASFRLYRTLLKSSPLDFHSTTRIWESTIYLEEAYFYHSL